MFKLKAGELECITDQYEALINGMLKLRNEVFSLGKKLKNNLIQQLSMFTCEQLVQYCSYFRENEQSVCLKFRNLWSVKKKKKATDNCQDEEAAMTDSEIDQTEATIANIDEDVSKKFKILSTVKKEAQVEENKMANNTDLEPVPTQNITHHQFNFIDEVEDGLENDEPGLLDVDHGLLNNQEQDYFIKDLDSIDRFYM